MRFRETAADVMETVTTWIASAMAIVAPIAATGTWMTLANAS